MAIAAARSAERPMMDLNTTPLIDVLLVLLILFIMTIPVATHSLDVDVASDTIFIDPPPIDPVVNRVVVTDGDAIQWNGHPINERQLAGLLRQTMRMAPQPELQLAPESNAGYDRTAHVTGVIKAAGVGMFGFVGNERFAQFGKAIK